MKSELIYDAEVYVFPEERDLLGVVFLLFVFLPGLQEK